MLREAEDLVSKKAIWAISTVSVCRSALRQLGLWALQKVNWAV